MRSIRITRLVLATGLIVASATLAAAQPLFTDAFPKEEFASRRARVAETIGDGVAIVHGAPEYPAYLKFRQANQFFYLTGVEVPRAILVIDGRRKRSTLFLPPRNERLEQVEGPVLVPGDEALKLTGVDEVLPRERFIDVVTAIGQEGRVVHTPFRPAALGAASPYAVLGHAAATTADPWDGRPSREAAFIEKLRTHAPGAEVRNLDPAIDAMRLIKSPAEIAVVREATRLSSLGIEEAMRAARPGRFEYELAAAADYVFRKHNAQGIAYYALVATGRNAHYPHYHAGQSRLADRDLVLFDYAPDFKYYTSDVTRMFPANGKFTPWQREIYTVYLRLYQALMTSIRPGITPQVVLRDATQKMETILASYQFTDPKIKAAAERFVDRYRTARENPKASLGHWVGMEVHDVTAPYDVLKPGMIFTIEPALTIPEDRVYIRLEDVILITESGYENLSGALPVEVADIERLMAREAVPSSASRRVGG